MAPGLSASPRAVLLLLSLLGLAAAGRLLVVPVDGSHWLSMREVLDILTQKGHEVVVVAPEVSLHIKPSKNFVMKMYSVPYTKEEMEKDFKAFFHVAFEQGSFLERFPKVFEGIKRIHNVEFSSCQQLLQNKELIKYLEENKFDAILTDPFVPCGAILAEHLSLPSINFLRGVPCGLDFEATQCPKPPSYVPRVFTDNTDRMSFLQRVKNLLFDIPDLFLCDFAFEPYSKLASDFLQREVTVLDLLRKGSIWLHRLDFVLDYPRPLMPNIIPIGGVNCAHKKLTQVGLVLICALMPFCVLLGTDFPFLVRELNNHARKCFFLPFFLTFHFLCRHLCLPTFKSCIVEGKHQSPLVRLCDGMLIPAAK